MYLPATADLSEAFMPTAKNKATIQQMAGYYTTAVNLRRAVRRPEVIAPLAMALHGSSLPLM